jgi:Legume lectin domain.
MYSHCQPYGGDGFAFVIQAEKEDALGESGRGLGFEGIQNSLAIEFDTYNNYENSDPFVNHISVHTNIGVKGKGNSANHATCSLGHTNAIPLLTQGRLTARIHYVPQFDVARLTSPSFVVSPPYSSFFLNQLQEQQHQAADIKNKNPEGEGMDYHDDGNDDHYQPHHHHPHPHTSTTTPSHPNLPRAGTGGMGLLTVYIEDLNRPVLSVPLNLSDMLQLNHGRAWVGFTASTGQDAFQVHDIYSWQFHSLRKDPM